MFSSLLISCGATRAFAIGDEVSWESEGDCTSERGAGQFSIFGAVEEKSGGEFGSGTRSASWVTARA